MLKTASNIAQTKESVKDRSGSFTGDIGDGGPSQTIYRIVEPAVLADKLTVSLDGELRYRYM